MQVCSVSTNNFHIGHQSRFLSILYDVHFESLLTLSQVTFLGNQVGSVDQLRNMNIFFFLQIFTSKPFGNPMLHDNVIFPQNKKKLPKKQNLQ